MTQIANALLLASQAAHAFYDSSKGRWINRDPIEERGDLNLMGFVRNDPQNLIDPLGKETVQVWLKTEIRPPHIEDGTKTIHSVVINEYGAKVSETTFIGITPLPVPLPGVGTLTANVSGSHPSFSIAFSGSAFSLLPVVGGGLIPGPVGVISKNLIIDYSVDVHLDFCARTGSISGAHDGFSSYVITVKGRKVYDFQQTSLPALLPPLDINPDVNFTW